MTDPSTPSGRRRFNRRERVALYLAADGQCSNPDCDRDLEPGWHGDHIKPWSSGGPTDVINGQAMCPTCNLKKGGKTVGFELRDWQQRAIDTFFRLNKKNFMVAATPGAGKTTFSIELAKRLLEGGTVERIAVVVSTDTLRQQWADDAAAAGIALMPVSDPSDYDKDGYQGYVATYQQLARGAGAAMARRATAKSTIVLLDEIHHAGEKKSWGDGLLEAYEHATYRVCLTGTPWRENKHEPIPFVDYAIDGQVIVDFAYEYGQAVADGVCRPLEFHAYDGEAQWLDCGQVKRAELGIDLEDEDVGVVLDAVLRPDHAWMPALLSHAVESLNELRIEVPDAGGLVVAHEQWQARAYADILEQITGQRPVVATSDDPAAKDNITAFKKGRSAWIVAVRMVSEGVDIPRLGVTVFAAKIKTPLFFRQVSGRSVRKRMGDPEFNARMFIPAIPVLMAHAAEIEEELRHQLEIDTDLDEKSGTGSGGTPPLESTKEPLSASEALFGSSIFRGDNITAEQHAAAEEMCRQSGIPLNFAVNVAKMFNIHGQAYQPPGAAPAPTPVNIANTPRWRRERGLRSEVDRLVGKYAYRTGVEKKKINEDLARMFGRRKELTIDSLELVRDQLEKWLSQP